MPLTRRIPKRGFTNIFREPWAIINLRDLNRFAADTVVDEAVLREAGLVAGKPKKIKLLGQGEMTVALTVKVQAVSAQAKARLEAAGGKVEISSQ
jgi:large subunit ribosomal protein L15